MILLQTLILFLFGFSHAQETAKSTFKACANTASNVKPDCCQSLRNTKSLSENFSELRREVNSITLKNEIQKKVSALLDFRVKENQVYLDCLDILEKKQSKSSKYSKCETWLRVKKQTLARDHSKMKVSLALSQPKFQELKIGLSPSLHFSKSPSHSLSGSASIDPLSTDEVNTAERLYWKNAHTQATKLGSSKALEAHLRNQFAKDALSDSQERDLATAMRDFQKQQKREYFAAIAKNPILRFIKNGTPSFPELRSGFQKIQIEIKETQLKLQQSFLGDKATEDDWWTQAYDYRAIVEDVLLENPQLCSAADNAQMLVDAKRKKDKILGIAADAGIIVGTFAVCIAQPHFCVPSSLAASSLQMYHSYTGLQDAQTKAVILGDLESYAELNDQERGLMVEALVLPLGSMGSGTVTKTTQSIISSEIVRGKNIISKNLAGKYSFNDLDFQRRLLEQVEEPYSIAKKLNDPALNYYNSLGIEFGARARLIDSKKVLTTLDKKIKHAAQMAGLKDNQLLLPARIFVNDKKEILALTTEQKIPEGFKPATTELLSFDKFYEVLADGKFPLGEMKKLAAENVMVAETGFLHDLGHFRSFTENPSYMKEVRGMAEAILKEQNSMTRQVLEDRLYNLNEFVMGFSQNGRSSAKNLADEIRGNLAKNTVTPQLEQDYLKKFDALVNDPQKFESWGGALHSPEMRYGHFAKEEGLIYKPDIKREKIALKDLADYLDASSELTSDLMVRESRSVKLDRRSATYRVLCRKAGKTFYSKDVIKAFCK